MSISETIMIDAGPAIEQLDAVAAAADRAAEAMARLGKGGSAGLGADKLAASMAAAADRIEQASTRAAAAMGRMSTAARAATGGIDSLGTSADAAAAGEDRLAESATAAGAAMDRQAVAGARAGATAKESAGFFSRHKEALLGTAIVLGYSVDKAMRFNAQMTLLNTQAGVSTKEMPQLTKGVLELAGATGQSPGNLAESLYHVASNMESMKGTTPVKMLQAVKIAAEGAAVGHSNLVDTTTALTSVLASGIPGAKNYSQAMGALNKTVGVGEMSMQDLAEAMGTGVVPIVKGYGLNLKDVGASLATFGDLNIRGAKAGTDLRMAVQSLAVQSPTATKELEKLGLTSGELGKNMQANGLLSTLELVNRKFKENGITAKNEGSVITELFGKRAGVGLALLLENMSRVESKYPALTQGANEFGKAWDKTLQTPQQKLKQLESGAQALAITAGNVLMPAASGILGGLDKAFQFIQGNAFASKGLALGAGGLVAGGLAKGLFSGVAGGLSGLGKIGSVLKIPGADRLANVGQSSGLTGAASALDGAAGSLEGAAASLKGAGVTGGAAGAEGAAARGAGGAGAGAAAGGGLLSTVRAALGPAIAGALIGEVIRGIGDDLAPKGSTAGRVNAALQQQAARAPSTLHPYTFGGLEAKAATSSIGLSIGKAISEAFSQRAPAQFVSPAAARFGSSAGTVSAPAVRPPSTAQATAASAQIAHAMERDLGRPVKVAAPDMSALNSARGKAQAVAAAIAHAMETSLHKPVKMTAPDLSAAAAAAGKARADGANISAGLAAGIESNKGAVVAAAADVANAAAAAMAHAVQARSPSKKTEKIGKDTAQGFIVGLEGGKSAVDAAAAALGKNAAKAADIASIDSTAKRLLGEVPKGDTGLTKLLRADQSKLTGLAGQRARLEAEITDAQDIAKQAISNANITGAGSYQPALAAAGGPLSSYATISGMKSMAADQAQFAKTVAQLKKMGLNATSLSQIVQAGPSALPMAQGLAQGGKGAVGQVNQLETQIHASAARLGNSAAGPMYQAGVDAGKGLAQGIRSQLGTVEAAMRRLAQAMVNAVKHELKAHSPSLVFHDIGVGAPQGFALGVDAGSGIAEASVRRMGQRAVQAWPGGGGHGGGGSGGHTTIINVQGHVMTEHDLVSLVQEHVLTRANNNWQGGWKLPGRAT